MNNELFEALKQRHQEMKSWMEYMHQHPEPAMTEEHTSKYLADLVKSFGFEVEENIGKYGMVATLKLGDGDKILGLRAEFDALPIQEDNDLPYKSPVAGKGHLCGHDGHTTMLLGAAKYLAETKSFNGTLRLILQPAEETMEGGSAMIKDGLFERFPVDAAYAMHNIPGLEFGKLYFRENATMSAVDNWEIELTGKGSHGSMPELGIDPITCGASLVMALQTIVSRNVTPWAQTVVNVGSFQSGNTGNVVPQTATLKLSVRNMDNEVRKMVLDRIRKITQHQAEAFNCEYKTTEGIAGTVLMNTPKNTRWAADIAIDTFGEENVIYDANAILASEDFAFMLEKVPGNYVMIGNGDTFMVHHPKFIFNQDLLPIGATYWVALAQNYLK